MQRQILIFAPAISPKDTASLQSAAEAADSLLVFAPAFSSYESFSPALGGHLRASDAIIFQESIFEPDWLDIAEICLMLAHAGPGGGGIELERARDLGIQVVSVPDGATDEFAQLTLSTLEKMIAASPFLTRRRGNKSLRLGLVGFGQVGRSVGSAAVALGISVWAADPFASDDVFEVAGVRRAELLDLLGMCDVISLHVPLVPATQGLINTESLALMKSGACLINTSDPVLLKLHDILKSLARGKLGFVALAEPPGGKIPLASGAEGELFDVLAHSGTLLRLQTDFLISSAVRRRSIERALAVVLDYFAGGDPPHLLIDPPLPRRSNPVAALS